MPCLKVLLRCNKCYQCETCHLRCNLHVKHDIYHYTFWCKTWYLWHIWLLKRDVYDTLHMWNVALTIHFPCETWHVQYSLHEKHDFYNTFPWKHDMYDTFYILNLAFTIHVTCKTWHLRYSFTSIRWCTITRGSW